MRPDGSASRGSESFMSGTPSWARTEESMNSTSEWTMLCGWMTASICPAPAEEVVWASMISSALFMQRGRVDGDLPTHGPGRMGQGLRHGDGGEAPLLFLEEGARPRRSG